MVKEATASISGTVASNKYKFGQKTYTTLAAGKRAKEFTTLEDQESIRIFTGKNGATQLLYKKDLDLCLEHFSGKGWFLLGNTVDDIKPGSLGEYFKGRLRASPKFASHYASIMVNKGLLAYRYGQRNSLELKVLSNDRGEAI